MRSPLVVSVARAVRLAATAAFLASALPILAADARPGPALLVLNKEDASLAIVDPATGQVVGKVATGDGPHEVVTDGARAFVSNYGAQTPGATLSVIDLQARKELRRFDLGPLRRPHGLAFVDGMVYLTAETNRLVARYDPASDRLDWMLGTGQAGTHMLVVYPSGSPIFTTNIGSDTVSVMERGQSPTTWSVTQIPVGRGPEAIDSSPDRTELWVAHSRDGGVSVIDVASKTVKQTLDLRTKRSNRLKFSPDGRLVLISDLDAGELVVVDPKKLLEVKRIPLGRSPEGILVVPDGSRAYVAVTGDNHVAVIDLATLEVKEKIATGAGPDGMAWVP